VNSASQNPNAFGSTVYFPLLCLLKRSVLSPLYLQPPLWFSVSPLWFSLSLSLSPHYLLFPFSFFLFLSFFYFKSNKQTFPFGSNLPCLKIRPDLSPIATEHVTTVEWSAFDDIQVVGLHLCSTAGFGVHWLGLHLGGVLDWSDPNAPRRLCVERTPTKRRHLGESSLGPISRERTR
jgi:hypothetical protein